MTSLNLGMSDLPKTMKALVLRSTSEAPTIETVPVPEVTPGAAIVRVLAANVLSYIGDIYDGTRPYPFPKPLIPGISAVARVAAIAADATKFKAGDLVIVDPLIRSRDEPTDAFLAGIHHGGTEGSRKLMRDVWRDSTYAEYCRVPLENLVGLNEQCLVGEMGYSIAELAHLMSPIVPYGGLRSIDLRAGQKVIVAPATGPFGGAAVHVALAMGAFVIAMGRNRDALDELKRTSRTPDRIATVPITGDVSSELAELKKYGEIDAFFDIGPPAAAKSSHVKSAILALRHGGKMSLMSGYHEDVPLPMSAIVHNDLTIQGKWMYNRRDLADLLKLVEMGALKLGKEGGNEVVGEYPLEQYKKAW